ncbi:GNAT family N-acetyltransferase [Nocardiopsis sediminis]|uniref:GNAT family N-acetyltransferase n=1 Tax=Nocardiopsis sediminis TaxID=1778267 RepID=A0ABV8FNQ7_9ACTN
MIDVQGPSLRLRELRPADVTGLLAVYGDEAATRHLSFEPRTFDQCEAIIRSAAADATVKPRTVYMQAVADTTDDLVGAARLGIDERPHSGQIGFALRPEVWGRGLGAELVGLLLTFGFAELELNRLWGARSPDNVASKRVMERAGMIEEGRIRRHLRTRGAWRDSVVHSILDDEWTP